MTKEDEVKLTGVMVALATPVDEDGIVDAQGLERLIARVVDGGVVGICPAGTTGEGASLSLDSRLAVVDAVRRLAPKSMTVVPGIFAESVEAAATEAEAYALHGADAVLVSPPHYYILGGDDVVHFLEQVADRSPLPVVAYHIPAFTKNPVPAGAAARLAAHPSIIGIKDSSRDMEYLLEVTDVLRCAGAGSADLAVMTGTDTMLLAAIGAGASGAIIASANLVPEVSVGALQAWRQGRTAEAVRDEATLRAVVAACRVGTPPAGWKAALAAAGVCGAALVPPRSPLPATAAANLAARLAELGVAGVPRG